MKCCLLPEGEVVEHVDDVAAIVFILFSQMFQYSDLFLRLSVESFLIPHHFQSNMLMRFVVVHFKDLSKWTFSYHFKNLVAISNVVMGDVDVGALK